MKKEKQYCDACFDLVGPFDDEPKYRARTLINFSIDGESPFVCDGCFEALERLLFTRRENFKARMKDEAIK